VYISTNLQLILSPAVDNFTSKLSTAGMFMNQTRLFSQNAQTLSILVPVFNESEAIVEFIQRLKPILFSLSCDTEIVFVDDGSTDNSCDVINTSLPISESRKLIKLSRNFGKEAALCAGLKSVTGDAVVIIDADLQDPPELIPNMVESWQAGADVVNMCRSKRNGESWFKKFSAKCFYRLLNVLSDTSIPENVGDFRLISRATLNVINAMPEKNLYMKGILSWPGFKTETLYFEREARCSGESKWPFLKLLKLAFDGITSFSTKPLQLATWSGALLAISAFIYGLFVVIKTMISGEAVAGYPTLMVVILALGGFQLLTVGIMGAYIGRIYTEVKNRPRYVIQDEMTQQGEIASVQSIQDATYIRNKG
jgi:glycosyltransferase involved in cell wall biosynthesis